MNKIIYADLRKPGCYLITGKKAYYSNYIIKIDTWSSIHFPVIGIKFMRIGCGKPRLGGTTSISLREFELYNWARIPEESVDFVRDMLEATYE
jgi:hypothetical protein